MMIGPIRGRGILEVPGIALGHAGECVRDRLTGVTVLLPPRGSTVAVDVRGGGPATHETDVIAPGTHTQGADAIVLTGGSALGLRSVSGVVTALAEVGRGFPAPGLPGVVVPIVPAAAIYDLGRGGGPLAPPSEAEGAEAARSALAQATAEVRGSLGAGTGARSGLQSLRGGLGSFALGLPGGVRVAALVAANPFGSIGTTTGPGTTGPGTAAGELWARPLLAELGLDLPRIKALPAPLGDAAAKNTTIAIVATNARLDSAQAHRLAQTAHAGIARAVRPSHTLYDGDTVFAVATSQVALPEEPAASTRALVDIGQAAADALSLAILDAHASAIPVGADWCQPPTLTDVAPEFATAFTALP